MKQTANTDQRWEKGRNRGRRRFVSCLRSVQGCSCVMGNHSIDQENRFFLCRSMPILVHEQVS